MNNNRLNYISLPDGMSISLKEIIAVSGVFLNEVKEYQFDILLISGHAIAVIDTEAALDLRREKLLTLIGATSEFTVNI